MTSNVLHPRIAEVVAWLQENVRPDAMRHLRSEDLEGFVGDLLFGSRDIAAVTAAGIITKLEAANFILAHVGTWALHQTGETEFSSPQESQSDSAVRWFADLLFPDAPD